MSTNKNVLKIPADTLFPIVEEYLANEQEVVICVRGNSMFPLIRNITDSIKLKSASFDQIKKLDIVLIRRDSEAYILHRVCKKTPSAFYLVGDNQKEIEGPLRPDNLIAVVAEIYRGELIIRRGSLFWNVYGWIWLVLRPFREPILSALVTIYSAFKRKRE